MLYSGTFWNNVVSKTKDAVTTVEDAAFAAPEN
jgi:hypothetical protein